MTKAEKAETESAFAKEMMKAKQQQMMLSALSAAQNASPSTLLGFGIGQLLKNYNERYWNNWRNDKYNTDGTSKNTASGTASTDNFGDAWKSDFNKDMLNRVSPLNPTDDYSMELPSLFGESGNPENNWKAKFEKGMIKGNSFY